MTISELTAGDVVTIQPFYEGYWMFTGQHPDGGIVSQYLMIRVDAWPFDVQSFDGDTPFVVRHVVVHSELPVWYRGAIGIQFARDDEIVHRVVVGGDVVARNGTEGANTVSGRIAAICKYLQEHLGKSRPEESYPVSLRLAFHTPVGRCICDLCGRLVNSSEQVLSVDYETSEQSGLRALVCVNLKACQRRRDAEDAAAVVEQQKIAETVILP